jgi:hypothetical protein
MLIDGKRGSAGGNDHQAHDPEFLLGCASICFLFIDDVCFFIFNLYVFAAHNHVVQRMWSRTLMQTALHIDDMPLNYDPAMRSYAPIWAECASKFGNARHRFRPHPGSIFNAW